MGAGVADTQPIVSAARRPCRAGGRMRAARRPGCGAPRLRRVGTVEQAYPAAAPGPGFWWRLLSPLGAVLAAFVLLIAVVLALELTALGEDGRSAVATVATSFALLVFGVLLWRRLPAHERRVSLERKGSLTRVVATGVLTGFGIVVGAAVVIATGSAIDPVVERRLEELSQEIGATPWQIALTVVALVVFAPLGEELLFRALLLRGLVRRLAFPAAVVVSSALFAAAHADAYLLWPRAVALLLTGCVLAWLYRRRGFVSSVLAHATVNAVAAVALILTQ